MPTATYSAQRKLFAERSFKHVDGEAVPLAGALEIRRFIERKVDRQIAKDTEYQYAYVSAANANPAAYVTNPLVDCFQFTGRYRLARLEYDKERGGFIQTLRLGFADALAWEEARLTGGQSLAEAERYALVTFRNLNPAKLQDMIDTLYAEATITDATVQTHKFAGVWNILWAKPSAAEDGSGILTVLIGLPQYTLITYEDATTPTERAVVYCFNVPKQLAQALADTYRAEVASAGTASYSTDKGTVDMIFRRRLTRTFTILNRISEKGCLAEEFTDLYFGYTSEECRTFDPGTRAQGWLFNVSQPSATGDGLYNFTVIRRHSIDCVTHDASKADDETMAAVEHTAATEEAVPDAPLAQGDFQEVSNAKNPDCTFKNRVTTHTEVDQAATDAANDASETSATAKHTAATDPAAVVGDEGSPIVVVENVKTKGGKWRTAKKVTVELDQTGSAAEKDANHTADEATHTAAAVATTIEVGDGAIVVIENAPTRGGKVRTRKRKTTLLNQTRQKFRVSAAAEATTTDQTAAAAVDAADRAPGTVVDASNEPNADGSSRTSKTVTRPQNQTATSKSSDFFGTTESVLDTEHDPVTSFAPAAGTTRKVTQAPTEAGNARVEDEVDTKTPRTYTLVVSDDYFETVELDRGWHQDAGFDTTHEDGKIKEGEGTYNTAGKHEWTVRIRSAVHRAGGTSTTADSDIFVETLTPYRNQINQPSAAAGQRIIGLNWNQFNRWDYMVVTRTLKTGLAPKLYTVRSAGRWQPYAYDHWNVYATSRTSATDDSYGGHTIKGPFRQLQVNSYAFVRTAHNHTITYHASEAAALAAIDNAGSSGVAYDGTGSSYHALNEERTIWEAHKVESVDEVVQIIDRNSAPSM